jgi:hypothetical protein
MATASTSEPSTRPAEPDPQVLLTLRRPSTLNCANELPSRRRCHRLTSAGPAPSSG